MRKLTPWDIFIRSAMICLLIAAVFFGVALRKIERSPLSGQPLKFDAKQAHQYMETLSTRFPYRLPWHENRRKAGRWIDDQLKKIGLTPKEMVFSEIIAGKQYTDLRNIYAEIEGSKFPNEIILLAAHYDTTDTTIEGAMDDASGVGVVLELARVFSKEKPERSMVFLLTDSEEFGAFWGARVFARSYERKDQIIAAPNFDFVAPNDQVAILHLSDGLKTGYTPLWLREMALDSLRSIGGFEARDMMNITEFVQRAILIPAADHGAFLQEGIPSFNWAGQMKNFAHQMAYYHHTKEDKAEFMKVESFHDYGRAAEKLVRSLHELPAVPANFRDSDYWKITRNLYLDGWAVTILHILAFIPFLLYSLSRFGSVFKSIRANRGKMATIARNELKNIGILLGSFLIGYLLRLLPALKIITQYEGFPATQKSEILYSPNYLAIILVVACIVAVYKLFSRVFREKEDSDTSQEIRHAVHAVMLALIIFLAFLGNSYLATLLLLPPAYFWMGIRAKRGTRITNFLLLLGGVLTFLIVGTVMGSIFHIGVVYWYLFLATAYGLVSVYTCILALMGFTVMVRIFRSSVLKSS